VAHHGGSRRHHQGRHEGQGSIRGTTGQVARHGRRGRHARARNHHGLHHRLSKRCHKTGAPEAQGRCQHEMRSSAVKGSEAVADCRRFI
jgi:hypothetical protein